MNRKKSSYSRRFIHRFSLITGIFLSLTFMITALLIYLSNRDMEKLIATHTHQLIFSEATLLEKLLNQYDTVENISPDELAKTRAINIIIAKKSSDDRYFSVVHYFNKSRTLEIPQGPVKEKRSENFFKEGELEKEMDSRIFSDGSLYWQNVYFPLLLGQNKYVVRASYSVSENIIRLKTFTKKSSNYILVVLIATALVFATLTFLSLHFFQGISYFFKRLSRLAISIRKDGRAGTISEDDEDFAEVARSFNILAEEIRTRDERIATLENSNKTDYIFKEGVVALKKQEYENAEHLFHTLLIFKPKSFGSYFNLGVIYSKQGAYTEALDMFEAALTINPKDKLAQTYCTKLRDHLEATSGNEKIS